MFELDNQAKQQKSLSKEENKTTEQEPVESCLGSSTKNASSSKSMTAIAVKWILKSFFMTRPPSFI